MAVAGRNWQEKSCSWGRKWYCPSPVNGFAKCGFVLPLPEGEEMLGKRSLTTFEMTNVTFDDRVAFGIANGVFGMI